MIVVHVTHEAVEKMGGIGAVISGLTTADAYARSVSRTILVGPLLSTDKPVNLRLGHGGHVLYSSLDAIHTPPWREKFMPIERTYDVGIVYGRRPIDEPCTGRRIEAEVILVDVFHSNRARLDLFKGELYKKFGIVSDRFENVWEFEEYVRLAEPGFEALKVVGCNGSPDQVVILAHEYMGMPLALKAVLAGAPNTRTVFYAHEVASVRPIVEKAEGHDTMFYNVLGQAGQQDRELQDLFPSVHENYKHPLVRSARYCDRVFAVGDYVREELRFLDRHFRTKDIDLVYNGIPSMKISLAEKRASGERMRAYCRGLFGFTPTWIFTHVARPVLSKGVWRDLAVLHHLEGLLSQRGETAVYFMLGTLAGQRRPQDVRQMERVYGWPLGHETGYPDLCQGEEVVGQNVESFNRGHRAVRAVFVNQWDWNRTVCGDRMPADMTFRDIRAGSDVELGLSVYEPFGISQLEPLCFGALCAVSNVCGCVGFARRAVAGGAPEDNVLEADFLSLPHPMGVPELLALSIPQRDELESREAALLAERIVAKLPRGEGALQGLIASGQALAERMSWERVVEDYFLPSLTRAAH
jgi:hypothetical protein